MKALVYHGAGSKAWEQRPRPTVKASTDVGVHGKALKVVLKAKG